MSSSTSTQPGLSSLPAAHPPSLAAPMLYSGPGTRTQPPPAAQAPAHRLHAPGLRAAQDSNFFLCSAGFRDPQWIGSAPTREWIALATRSSAPTAPKSKRSQKKKTTSQKVPRDHPEPVQPSPHAHRKKISSGRNPDHSTWSDSPPGFMDLGDPKSDPAKNSSSSLIRSVRRPPVTSW